jgi:phospholipid N-methyltransferase
MNATFIEDFYPTPTPVIEKMLDGLKMDEIEDVLDLGAGRGVIAQHIVEVKEAQRYSTYSHRERAAQVDVVEINSDFYDVLKAKGFRLVHDDILTFETLKVYHLIIANFPFSIGAECLQRALALVERNGGHLRCLVNAETITNPFTNVRKSVVRRLEELGAEIEYLSGAFAAGERPTQVDAALIKLHVKRPEAPSIILDSLRGAESHQESAPRANSQIVGADFAGAMVAQFNLEARAGIRLIEEYNALRPHILDRIKKECDVDDKYDYSKPLIKLEVEGASDYSGNHVNQYLAGLREKYWSLLINDPRFYKLYTSNILTELQSKLKELRNYDFTIFNIGELIREMRGKIVEGIESSILALFDEMSRKFAYNEDIHNGNVHYYNGWKTNKAYKINRKIILPMNGLSSWSFSGPKLEYDIHRKLADMVKVFNYLSDDRTDVGLLVSGACGYADNTGNFDMDLRYFRVKFFKKGTAHIWFLDEHLLAKFNIFGSQRKHWLPPAYGKKARETMNRDEQAVVDDFHTDCPVTYDEVLTRAKFFIVEEQGLLQLASGELKLDAGEAETNEAPEPEPEPEPEPVPAIMGLPCMGPGQGSLFEVSA